MPTPFIMPKFDMDQTSATVVEWLKVEGDFVLFDEAVLVVETEKVATEVTAPASGILTGIRAKQGDQVPVTEVIAYILAEDETASDIPEDEPATTMDPAPDVATPTLSATPVAIRMAKEFGIDLGEVTVAGGRIRSSDVKRFVSELVPSGASPRAAATPAARRLAREMDLDLSQITGTGPRGRIQGDDVKRQGFTPGKTSSFEDRPAVIQPLTSMRRTIAERMQASSQTAPHIALSIDVDVTRFEEERSRLNTTGGRNEVENISMTALLVYLAAQALSRHPEVNASFFNDHIYLWEDINIGVATALEGGLVVPVVHKAGELTPETISKRLRDLVGRAKLGQLSLSEVRGGSFTLSNLGMVGIHQFRAIINPPESAILAIGAIVRKPVVINDLDEIGVRPVLNLTLSVDHRILDGVSAARFLNDLAQSIQNPGSLPS
jgi:pyruvate dehydrogenase E2 component (dihydrolipoamide acetyltransferase)